MTVAPKSIREWPASERIASEPVAKPTKALAIVRAAEAAIDTRATCSFSVGMRLKTLAAIIFFLFPRRLDRYRTVRSVPLPGVLGCSGSRVSERGTGQPVGHRPGGDRPARISALQWPTRRGRSA